MKRQTGSILICVVLCLLLAGSIAMLATNLIIPGSIVGLDALKNSQTEYSVRSYRNVFRAETSQKFSGDLWSSIQFFQGKSISIADSASVTGSFSVSWLPTNSSGFVTTGSTDAGGVTVPTLSGEGSYYLLTDKDLSKYSYHGGKLYDKSNKEVSIPSNSNLYFRLSRYTGSDPTLNASEQSGADYDSLRIDSDNSYTIENSDTKAKFWAKLPEQNGLVELASETESSSAAKKVASFVYRSKSTGTEYTFYDCDFVSGLNTFSDSAQDGKWQLILGKSAQADLSVQLSDGTTVARTAYFNQMTDFEQTSFVELKNFYGLDYFAKLLVNTHDGNWSPSVSGSNDPDLLPDSTTDRIQYTTETRNNHYDFHANVQNWNQFDEKNKVRYGFQLYFDRNSDGTIRIANFYLVAYYPYNNLAWVNQNLTRINHPLTSDGSDYGTNSTVSGGRVYERVLDDLTIAPGTGSVTNVDAAKRATNIKICAANFSWFYLIFEESQETKGLITLRDYTYGKTVSTSTVTSDPSTETTTQTHTDWWGHTSTDTYVKTTTTTTLTETTTESITWVGNAASYNQDVVVKIVNTKTTTTTKVSKTKNGSSYEDSETRNPSTSSTTEGPRYVVTVGGDVKSDHLDWTVTP